MIHQFEEIVKIRTICFSYSWKPEKPMGDCFFFGFACIFKIKCHYFHCKFKKIFDLDLKWMWYHFEWQSRTSIHAHGVVKLKHYPDLLTKVYIGLLMVHNLADSQYTADLSE